jgi:hypothetical protein
LSCAGKDTSATRCTALDQVQLDADSHLRDPSNAPQAAIAKTESYLYFDPRSSSARGTMPPPSAMRHSNPSSSATATGTSLGGGGPGALPGSLAPGMGATFGQRRQGFSEAIVFTVGGGSLEEYGNLQEWVARTAGPGAGGRKRVVYGSTEMLNAGEFIRNELELLGREAAS